MLAGCTTGAGSTAPATSCVPAAEITASADASGSPTSVTIVARDDRFDPPCAALPAAGTVRIVVRNDGAHPHNLVIGDRRVAVDAGQVGILDIEVGPGDIPFVCTIHSGMVGELRVGG